MKQVKINKLNSSAIVPTRGSIKAAGYDLYATENYILKPGERKLFKTGLSMEIPSGLYGRIAPRSGLAYKHGIDVLAGVIDEDYRGEIGVILINFGNEDKAITANDKIAQIIFENYTEVDFKESVKLEETTRGSGGYGSTDRQKGFVLGNRTSVEKGLASLTPEKRSIAAAYLQRFDGEMYFYQENEKIGVCVIDGSGTVLGKVNL
jgi:dUTP pyrophosphatase